MSAAQAERPDHPAQHVLDAALKRRAELLGSIHAVNDALESASPGRESAWAARVAGALTELQSDMTEHIETTEAPDGVHAEIVAAAPRLIHQVERHTAEHEVMRSQIDACHELAARCASDPSPALVQAVRDETTQVVGLLRRHRQRGADLVYEAYSTDIGGTD